jgi:hypothetical protein
MKINLSDQAVKRIAKKLAQSWTSLDGFVRQYLETALWSSNDESDESGGEPLDSNYGIEDFDDMAIQGAIRDCDAFRAKAGELLDRAYREYGQDDERQGHDFWLTRNGHGAGFWDGDYGDIGDELTKIAEGFGEKWPYVGDDGMIYIG